MDLSASKPPAGAGGSGGNSTPGPVRYKHNHRPGFSCPACYIKSHGSLPDGFFEAQEKKERETSDKVGAVMATIRDHKFAKTFLEHNFGRPRHLVTPEFVDLASVAAGVLDGKYKARAEFFLRDVRAGVRSALAAFHPASREGRAARDLIRLVVPQVDRPYNDHFPQLVAEYPPGTRVDVKVGAQWKRAVVLTYSGARVYLHFDDKPMEEDAWLDLTVCSMARFASHTSDEALAAARRTAAPQAKPAKPTHCQSTQSEAPSLPQQQSAGQRKAQTTSQHPHLQRGRAWYSGRQVCSRDHPSPFTAETSGLFPPTKLPNPLPPSIFEAPVGVSTTFSGSVSAQITNNQWLARNRTAGYQSPAQPSTAQPEAQTVNKKRPKPIAPFDRNMAKTTIGEFPQPPRKILRRGVRRPVTLGSRVRVDMLGRSEPAPIIERLVARRKNMRRRGTLEYCVHWSHKTIQEATWETRKALMNVAPALVLQFDARHPADPYESFPEPESQQEAEEYEEIERQETRIQELDSLKAKDFMKDIPVPTYFEQPLLEMKMGGGMTLQFRRTEFILHTDAGSVSRDSRARRSRYREEFPEFHRVLFPPSSKELATEKRMAEEKQRLSITQVAEHMSLVKMPRHIGSVLQDRVVIGGGDQEPETPWSRHMKRIGLERVDVRIPPAPADDESMQPVAERSEAAKLVLARKNTVVSELRFDPVWCCYR